MPASTEESIEKLREQEKASYEKLALKAPDKIVRTVPIDPTVVQQQIGISGLPPLPKGFIKFRPHDFIVEEEISKTELATIDAEEDASIPLSDAPTLYADLVKIGLGTMEAVAVVSNGLGISPTKISYAGLKDGRAITSQRVSIRGVAADTLNRTSFTHVFLKPRHAGKGVVTVGQLSGNRFTIHVRTENPVDEQTLQTRLQELQENGFPNFYGAQRFGTRLLNPLLGTLLCQGNTEEAIHAYLTKPGPLDIPIFTVLRSKAEEVYGDWEAMMRVYDILPYAFRNERRLLSALLQTNTSYHKGLIAIQDQVKFWVYGYASYLINRTLSRAYEGKQDIPESLPIPLGSKWSDELYIDELEKDETTEYMMHLRQLPFLNQKHRTIPAWIFPTVHKAAVTPTGAVISFTLPKAAYATTFLMFLFQVYEGTPIPDWVHNEMVDSKEILGTGSVANTIEKLGYVEEEALVAQEESE